MGAFDDNSNGIIFGGTPGAIAGTGSWNGTSWTEVADLATGRSDGGGCGNGTAAICFGGKSPPVVANTEEWNIPLATVDFGTD